MRARAVIGANFGDEGKGLFVDYLCATQGAGIVVRYNGGAQAGHTVVTPEGKRHIFRHFGAGTFCGVPTFLSQYFICNPLAYLAEAKRFYDTFGQNPVVYAHPNCLVTTFADMIINQVKEDRRLLKRHGSCGLGVHETQVRSELPHLKITMSDLWNGVSLTDRLVEICGKYSEFRTGSPVRDAEPLITDFQKRCEIFANLVNPLGIQQCKDPVFEGAQGLLLDQDNKEFFPHVTHSKTGITNVAKLCRQAGIKELQSYYVSRTYLTRHGAGPLPGEDSKLSYYDDTNTTHTYQGDIRFAPLDTERYIERVMDDIYKAGSDFKYSIDLVLTHCDQLPAPCTAVYYASGPTRNYVEPHKVAGYAVRLKDNIEGKALRLEGRP